RRTLCSVRPHARTAQRAPPPSRTALAAHAARRAEFVSTPSDPHTITERGRAVRRHGRHEFERLRRLFHGRLTRFENLPLAPDGLEVVHRFGRVLVIAELDLP